MNKTIKNILTINNNVLNSLPYLLAFYSNYDSKDRDFLLSYLILPIVKNQQIVNELKRIRIDSNIFRLVKQEYLIGFVDSFNSYKQLTNLTIQYAINCELIEIGNLLTIKCNKDKILDYFKKRKFLEKDNAYKFAQNLPKLFKSRDIFDIYNLLGIKQV